MRKINTKRLVHVPTPTWQGKHADHAQLLHRVPRGLRHHGVRVRAPAQRHQPRARPVTRIRIITPIIMHYGLENENL